MRTRITLRVLSPDDFAACHALWQRTEGIVLRPWENESGTQWFCFIQQWEKREEIAVFSTDRSKRGMQWQV